MCFNKINVSNYLFYKNYLFYICVVSKSQLLATIIVSQTHQPWNQILHSMYPGVGMTTSGECNPRAKHQSARLLIGLPFGPAFGYSWKEWSQSSGTYSLEGKLGQWYTGQKTRIALTCSSFGLGPGLYSRLQPYSYFSFMSCSVIFNSLSKWKPL